MSDVQTQVAPGYAFPSRVLSIPLVAQSIDSLHSTLSTSPYTQRIYNTSTSIAYSAYDTAARVSAPVYTHPRAQAYLTLADNYAVKGLDTVEAKFPYPFHSTPEKVYQDLRRAPEQAKEVASKTIDNRIKTPAYNLANTADQSLAPLVDILEILLVKIHAREASAANSEASSEASTSTAASSSDKAQILRAKALLLDAKDHLVTVTAEQAKALQEQNVYIQRASEHARSVNATLTTHYGNAQAAAAAYKGKGIELGKDAQARVHALSASMLAELEKFQATTVQLPAHIQNTLKPLTSALSATVSDLRTIIASDAPLGEKAANLADAVQARAAPVVEQAKQVYQAAVDKYVSKKETVKQDSKSYADAVKEDTGGGGEHVNGY